MDGPIYGTTDDANEPRICESAEYSSFQEEFLYIFPDKINKKCNNLALKFLIWKNDLGL